MAERVRVRLFQAGDLPGKNNNINEKQVKELVGVVKEKDWMAWTYTHKPIYRRGPNNKIVKYCNKNGLTVNLSANSIDHADELYKFKIGPVVVVVPEDCKKGFKTQKGNVVKICPASLSKKINCSICGGKSGSLCSRADRDFIIGFPAHGSSKGKINVK